MSSVAVAAASGHEPGFYGKLPSRGDFVSRRLPQPFVASWDAWLQQGIAASQAALGQRWLDVYLTSPIWHFALAPQVCGGAAYIGVLVPSVDRVGRYFPLTAALALPKGVAPAAAFAIDRWYAAVEEILLDALSDEALELEAFDARLAALSALSAPAAALAREPLAAHDAFDASTPPQHYALRAASDAPAALLAPLSHALGMLASYSLFWTQGSEHVAPCALFAPGLPAAHAYVAMLDGAFDARGWQSPARIETFVPRASAPLRAAAVTDVGKTRDVNEDAYACRDDIGVFVVADGLGGHQGGDVASAMVASVADGLGDAASLEERVGLLVRALRVVNGCLIAYADTAGTAGLAGSTVAALLVDGETAACVWAGDSRVYRWRAGTLEQLTRDHSEAPGAPGNRAVTRAVGGVRDLDLEVEYHEVLPGDRFLLCSDGLYGEVNDALLAAALGLGDPAAACARLKAAALDGEANDNLTAVVVEVGDRAGTLL